MATVKPGDREKTGMKGGKFPVSTEAQCISAVKLRNHGKGVSGSSVLAHAAAAARENGWKR